MELRVNALPDTGKTSRSRSALKQKRPPCGGDSKASGQLEPDGQIARGRGIAQVDRGVGEEFLLRVFDHATIAVLAAELFDILQVTVSPSSRKVFRMVLRIMSTSISKRSELWL